MIMPSLDQSKYSDPAASSRRAWTDVQAMYCVEGFDSTIAVGIVVSIMAGLSAKGPSPRDMYDPYRCQSHASRQQYRSNHFRM